MYICNIPSLYFASAMINVQLILILILVQFTSELAVLIHWWTECIDLQSEITHYDFLS